MNRVAVRIEAVSKRFATVTAVDGISLKVDSGMVYGLLGPNGAGKTTTIRMILDIIRPDTGHIELFGVPNTQPGILDRVGYLPEERGLYRKMQVRRVLRFFAQLKGVPQREAERRIDAWLERLGLRGAGNDWGDAKVEHLSRGMQQKVQFIATMLHEPDLVVLDEPFSGLDPVNAQALKDTVVDIRRAGKTVIFSTHIMDHAERLCDAVCIIAAGRKVLDGSLAEVKARYGGRHVAVTVEDGAAAAAVLHDPHLVKRVDDNNRFFEVELAEDADPQELLRRLVGAGVRLQRFELVQPSLHRIFLEKVGVSGVEEGLSGIG
jgi:ABC-2 type transport system ATP-binding protein